jgi:hypothetical protein
LPDKDFKVERSFTSHNEEALLLFIFPPVTSHHYSVPVAEIFGVVEGAVSAGFVCFARGFLWTGCGGMRGKDG